MRSIPQIAVTFVAAHEGLRLVAYQDSAGVWTLGLGHIEGVRPGDKCTEAQARQWLAEDLQAAASKLYGVLKPDVIEGLSDQQWTALLSFAFNLGAGRGWAIWRYINSGQLERAPIEMMRFVNAGGRREPGLIRRRTEEAALWQAAGITVPAPPGRRATLLVSAAGAAASAAPMIDQASRAIAPYAIHSLVVQRWLGLLAMAGAMLALTGLVLIWLRKHEARP